MTNSLTCDYLDRKTAIVFTTLMVVIEGIFATAAHGVTINGMFGEMTVARGIVGFGMLATDTYDPIKYTNSDLHRHWWRIPCLFNFYFRSRQRLNPEALRPSTHHDNQFPAVIRRAIRRVNLCDRAHGLPVVALQYRVARLLRHRVHLAAISILLPYPHAHFDALPPRKTRPLLVCYPVLLETADWDLPRLVSLWYDLHKTITSCLFSLFTAYTNFVTFPNGVFSGTII